MENTTLASCSNCKSENLKIEKFCPSCGFPEFGTEEEQRNYRLRINSRKRLIKDADKKIRTARIFLIVLAAFSFLGGLYYLSVDDSFGEGISLLVVSVVYLGLLAWVPKNPFGALLAALIVYITIQLLSIIVDPAMIIRGVIWKILIISALIKGIKSAKEAMHLRAEFEGAL